MNHPYRANLPAMPDRIRSLPVSSKGYPVPFFVEYIDGEPDFRVMDSRKMKRCVKERRCWVCGQPLGKYMAFNVGPMCSINRVSAEPPSHRECAEFSATACPFLTLPKAVRREANMPVETQVSGIMIARNPGVTLLWVTTAYKIMRVDNGILFDIGEPFYTHWYAEGRDATREEVMASISSGISILQEAAASEGPESERHLAVLTHAAMKYVPHV